MIQVRPLAIGLALLAGAAPATALPIVAIDADPAQLGIQSTRDVGLGGPFSIDVVISGVEVSAPLNAFEFNVDFSSPILSPVSVVDGGFLLDPVFVVEVSLGTVSVGFAEATLGDSGANGSGLLATITFDAIGEGTTPLDLNAVILSAPFGVPISTEAIEDGIVTVIPEPASACLLALGLAGLGLLRGETRSRGCFIRSSVT